MSALTKDQFPAIVPGTYGAINELRTELLKAFAHAAANPVSGQVLMDWLYDSLAVGITYTGLDAPE